MHGVYKYIYEREERDVLPDVLMMKTSNICDVLCAIPSSKKVGPSPGKMEPCEVAVDDSECLSVFTKISSLTQQHCSVFSSQQSGRFL